MNGEEFDAAIRRHQAAVTTYALALCSNREQARDAVQDTLLRAWQYLHTYRSDGSFEGWLLAICRRCVIDQASRESRHAAPAEALPVELDHETLSVLDDNGAVELLAVLDAMPLPAREVIVLCGWLGYDYEAAADILGIPVGTVRSRLHRARRELAHRLATDSPAVRRREIG